VAIFNLGNVKLDEGEATEMLNVQIYFFTTGTNSGGASSTLHYYSKPY